MDKSKLIQIIVKDLEELKFLTEEVTDIEGDATLIIDLAHSKARLLCQEIELLRELSVPVKPISTEEEEEIDEEEKEITDDKFQEPELEILNFEDGESSLNEDDFVPTPEEEFEEETVSEEVEIAEEPEEEEFDEEEIEEIQGNEPEAEEDEQVLENEIEPEVESIPEDIEEEEELDDTEEEEEEEEEIVYQEEDDEDFEETENEESFEDEELETPEQKSIQFTELGNDPNTKFREINIDEHDDDDIETIQFSPHSGNTDRSVMHEIPKPENSVIGEKFQKERSLNDAMGENKSNESKLTNGPISNLRTAIGLNDRFLFIREIFDNNTEKYNMVIENLDKLETIQQAVEYLKANLSLQKNDTSMKFVELLKRRFTK